MLEETKAILTKWFRALIKVTLTAVTASSVVSISRCWQWLAALGFGILGDMQK